jgi:hypothetical protein
MPQALTVAGRQEVAALWAEEAVAVVAAEEEAVWVEVVAAVDAAAVELRLTAGTI